MSRPQLNRLSAVTEFFRSKGLTHLREGRFPYGWLPLLLAPVLGLVLALLITDEAWSLVIAMILLVPAVILLSRYPFAAILVYVLVFPFFVKRPQGLTRLESYVLHWAMIPATLGYVLLSRGLGIIRRKEPIRFGPAELAMVGFLGLAVSSIFLSGSSTEPDLMHLVDMVFAPFCVYWLVRLTTPTEQDLKRLLWVAFFTVIIQVAIGLLAWYAPQLLPSQWLGRQGTRTIGTLSQVAVYSSTLIFLSLLLFQQAMQSRSGKLRAVLLSVFALGLLGVLFTFERGSWLAGAAVLLGLLLLYPKVTIRLTLVFATLTFILGNSLLANEVAYARKRLTTEDTAGGRVILLNTGLGMVAAKPLFGWGYGNYDRYDNQFKERVGDIPVLSDSTSHNTYLTIAAELGLIGLFLYLFPVAYWLVLSIKAWRRLPQRGFWSRRLLGILWLAIIAQIIVSSFMDMIRFHSFGTAMWWLTLGLIANMVYPILRSGDLGAPSWKQQPMGQV
jgi:O-antigen ligase